MKVSSRLGVISVVLLALALPVTLAVSQIVAAILKGVDPDNVDITQGLAYLSQILITGWLTFGLIMAAVAGLIVRIYKRDGDFSEAKFPLSYGFCINNHGCLVGCNFVYRTTS